jgi:hypothetical protein
MFPTIPPEVLLAIWLPLAGYVMALCLYDAEMKGAFRRSGFAKLFLLEAKVGLSLRSKGVYQQIRLCSYREA